MAELLKNVYTINYIENLSEKIKCKYEKFDEKGFVKEVFNSSWEDMELKQRMRHIALSLNEFLPLSYKEQLEILKPVSKDFGSYEGMFFQDFVEVFGIDDFENSIKALEVFTIDCSSEFAIRQFILKYEDKTMKQMKLWAKNENEHIRRLACEGCRPRLPWACALPKFKKDPKKVLEIIELLKNDKSKYVQKSVANNLNDISKDNPKIVIQFVKENLNKSKDLDWICKHASRTLLKSGDKQILQLFGYKEFEHINIQKFMCDDIVKIGEDFRFSFALVSEKNLGKIRVEYEIIYKKATRDSKKVFMVYQGELKQKRKEFSKKQSFKNMTTRKHFEGVHKISILVNGNILDTKEFRVIK